jgi:molybdopterin-containing oxidoreductase family membrane subunit
VAGAVYSGFAMVITLCIPLRKFYGLEGYITDKHLDNMAKVMLGTGLIVAYGYVMEGFTTWYNGSLFDTSMFMDRLTGAYAPAYWTLLLCNIVIPQLLWRPSIRMNTLALFIISIIINIGMWLERFIIVVTSLHHDFLPSSWGMFYPTRWDIGLFLGSIGLFLSLLFLFIRFLPVISIFETRELLSEEKENHA